MTAYRGWGAAPWTWAEEERWLKAIIDDATLERSIAALRSRTHRFDGEPVDEAWHDEREKMIARVMAAR